MNPDIVQLAAEHGTRSTPLFWGWAVALEMFVGGTAGALLVLTGVKRFATEVDSILRKIIVGCLLLAGALLLLDLGAKLQAFRFFLSWRPDSVIFWGTWIFALSLLAGILRFRVPGAVFGFGLMLYPGLLLVSMSGRSALWGAWVPLEFLMLSLASGVAVVMLVDPAVRNRGVSVRWAACGILVTALVARAAVLIGGQG